MKKKKKTEVKEVKSVDENKNELKRTKSDEYYDEVTKENEIIEVLDTVNESESGESDEVKEKVQKPKLTKKQFILLNIQFILSIITLILAIVYFFQKRVMFALQISLGLTMLITGVNNLMIYKRKAFTILYFLLGIVLLVLAIINILGI